MKKFILVLGCFFVFAKPCFAIDKPSGELYQELLEKYRLYQTQISPYNIAKSRQQSYQSIASRAEYLESAKNMLLAEIEAILAYTNFTRGRLAEATSILNYQENLYFIRLDDEITSLNLMKNKIAEISSFSELDDFWKELDNHYIKISTFGYLIKSYIEIGSFSKISDNLKITKEKISRQITENTSLLAGVKAAKDKFSVLEKDYSEILSTFNKASEIHKGSSENSDFKAGSFEIRKLINLAVLKAEKLVSNYQGIVSALVQQ